MYQERTNGQRAKNIAHARLALKYPDVEDVKRRLEELGVTDYPIRFTGGGARIEENEYELNLYYILSKYE
jgi:hypothetical protein